MTLHKTLLFAALLAPTLMAQAHEFTAGDVQVIHPWARETPPGAPAAAVYFTVSNKGTNADRLLGADTPAAGKAELHESVHEGDTMKMKPVQALDVPATGKAKLAPMGYHLMLLDLKEPLKDGKAFPLTLHFEKAGDLKVEVDVQNKDFVGDDAHKDY